MTSSSKKQKTVFDDFYVINYLMTIWSTDEMELSLQSRAHFVDLIVDLIFKKWSEAVSFLRLLCEIELLLQSAMMVAVMVRQPAIDNCPQLGSFLTKLPLMINCMLWLCLIFHLSRARHS